MNDLHQMIEPSDPPYWASAASTIQICIHRIEDLLDEEIQLLDRGAFDGLERINIRKSHLLLEFDRLSTDLSVSRSQELLLRMETCRLKAQRNFEALETYLRAMEDLNRLALNHLRTQESDGTYTRLIISNLRT